MKTPIITAMLFVCSIAIAAPAPYPVTVNSQSATIPILDAHRASEKAFAISLVDGSAKMDLTGHSVWMSWSTNANSTSASTARVDIVSATNGTATATFSPASVNYTPGRYMYEIGVSTGGTVRTVRHGVFLIYGSPYATGANPVAWTANWNLGLITLTGTIPLVNLPVTTNGASTSDVLIPTAGALSRAIAAAGVAYDDSWTNSLGSLAWLSSITSNNVDPDTDEAYRAGGETLWPASSNSVLTHVASHGVNEYGGFRAGTFIQGTGTDEEALFRSGILIGTNAACKYDSIRLGHGSATKFATDSNSISIGNFSTCGIGGTAIGHEAQAYHNAVSVGFNAGDDGTGSNSVSIGYCADAGDTGSVAIGPNANAFEPNCIQLGQGDNATENSFQVGEYPMLTLTDGLIPLARLSGITSNQIAAATDTAYRNELMTGITSNQMDAATDAAYRSATTETKSYWSLTMSGDQNNILGTNYNVVAFDTVVASGGASTIYTNTYSAKFGTTGVFHLGMRVRHSGMDTAKAIRSQFLISGNAQPEDGRDSNTSGSDSVSTLFQWNSIVAITNADATVQVTFYTTDAENDVDLIGNSSTFFGAKVSDL